jgi:hypothetical protein
MWLLYCSSTDLTCAQKHHTPLSTSTANTHFISH